MHHKQQFRFGLSPAFSTVELLIALGLAGTIAMLGVKLLLNAPNDVWPRMVDDYSRQLSAIYSKIQLETGNTPLQAVSAADGTTAIYADGISTLLQTWESTTVYTAASPPRLQYPSKMIVYLNPEDTNITDTTSQLPRHQASALTPDTPVTASSPKTIMANTNDREWILVDISGTDPPNNMNTVGDRVLLIVDDSTGQVLTAWQKCWMQINVSTTAASISNPYGAGTTCTMGPSTTPAFPAPTRVYYKSFFDVYKNYTGAY